MFSLVLTLLCSTPSPPPGLSLYDFVEKARANDLRVKEAEAELNNLRAKANEAFWAWFPKFETFVAVAGPTPEARNNGLGGPPTTPASFTWDWNFGRMGVLVRTEVNALLPLYTFGKISALREAGKQGVVVGEGLRARAQDEAAFQAAQTYFGYQLARQGKAALTDALTQLEEAGKTLEKLLAKDSRQVSKIDQYKIAYYREQVNGRLPQAEVGRELALTAAKLITADGSALIQDADLELPVFELLPLERYLEIASAHRPELKMINAGLTAREKEVFIKERMFLPDFGLLGFFRFQYTTSSTRQTSPFAYDPYNDLTSGVALVARMSFDVPVKQAQLDQSRAELAKLQTQRELLRAGIRVEIQKAHGDLRDALARAKAFNEASRNARRWVTAAHASFELGTSDTRELVEAFTAFATSSADKLKAWHDANVGIWALSKSVGTPLVARH
ncbi:MAG: TolC family protein [Myxococcaceae bacterium]